MVKKIAFGLLLLIGLLVPSVGLVVAGGPTAQEAQPSAAGTSQAYSDAFWATLEKEMASVPEGAEIEIDQKTGEVTILALPDAPQANCSGNACTGTDPVAMGCSGSPIGEAAYIYHPDTYEALGFVQHIYSSTCKTRWARVVSPDMNRHAHAELHRYQSPLTPRFARSGVTSSFILRSYQVYAPYYPEWPSWLGCGAIEPSGVECMYDFN